MEEKAATHDAMMKRFNLRKMSSSIDIPTKFGRANEIVIDKAIGSKLQRGRRYSLHRSIRSITSPKARQQAWRTLISPITPSSWTSTVHVIIMYAVYHFQSLYLPVFAGYYPDGSMTMSRIAVFLETIYLLDLLLHFNTAYVEQGVLVTSRNRIAHNYIHKWFAFDLLSAIPVQLIYSILTDSVKNTNDQVRYVQIVLMILRLLRAAFIEKGLLLSRIVRVASQLTDWARYSRYSHLLGIAQLMWLVLLFAHYMACLWHVVSHFHKTNAAETLTVGEMYVADYYYAVSLIQGQGNSGGTWKENVFSSVAIIAGSVILAIVFGNVAMLVSNFNANTTNYHRKMEAVYETMAKMDLPHRLRERVNEYYKHVWLEYEALDGNITKFQQELTHTLGIEVGLYKHMDLVVEVPFWKDCTPGFLTQIVLNLEIRVYMPDDYVVRRREIGNEMLMINRGYCKLSRPSWYTVDGEMIISKTMLSSYDLDQDADPELNEFSESEGESDNDMSSGDEDQTLFGTGMFGDSRRSSGKVFELPDDQLGDFTDVRRFQNVHPRRPSYPSSTGVKRSKKHQEYMHPGQVFGEMGLLMNYKRTANIRAITFVEMCVLSRKSFQRIISRYPEDRRRVLTKMLETCIEKKVIPFPWENIIEAVSAKRRNNGKKDISRASVIATMTTKEAARILVEAIDINAPDETIKYGFQRFDQNFIDDSSLRHTNSTDTKFSDTLQRRRSSIRSWKSISTNNSMTDISEGIAQQTISTETEPSNSSSPASGCQSDQTLQNLLLLVQGVADSVERLQRDVSDLRNGERGTDGNCSSQRVTSPTRIIRQPVEHETLTSKGDQDQTARKPSFVAPSSKRLTHRNSENRSPIAVLRRLRSKMQDDGENQSNPTKREGAVVGQVKSPRIEDSSSKPDRTQYQEAERYAVNLSGRSKASRNPTLADMLWKRSNTAGDLLKYTDEERNAARL